MGNDQLPSDPLTDAKLRFIREITRETAVLMSNEENQSVYDQISQGMERAMITRALQSFCGGLSQTAIGLGISRARLRRRMAALGMSLGDEIR